MKGMLQMRKKVHTACTIAAVIFTTICMLGVSPTWWTAAIVYALAIIFLILASVTSKEAERVMKEDEKPPTAMGDLIKIFAYQ